MQLPRFLLCVLFVLCVAAPGGVYCCSVVVMHKQPGNQLVGLGNNVERCISACSVLCNDTSIIMFDLIRDGQAL